MVFVTRLAAAATIGLTALALTLSVRWCYADWLSTRPEISDRQRAAKLSPRDATLWLRLADLTSVAGDDARPVLKRAASCSPSDARIWIRLGLEAETYRDYAEAERCLLHATRLDRDLIPAWTLANFYFRRSDAAHFFPAAHRVLAISQDDLTPIFRMAWALGPDTDRMLAEGMPDIPRPFTTYLNWLLASDLYDAAYPVATHLLSRFPHEGTDALFSYCNRLIAASRWQQAFAMWNDMDAKKLVATGPIRDGSILNPTFRMGSLNRGFDWHLASQDGIEVSPDTPSLRIRFSGNQPDHVEVASQMIRLDRRASYRLQYRLESSGLQVTLGLHWAALDPHSGVVLSRSADFSTAKKNTTWFLDKRSSGAVPDADPVRLVLLYERPPATPRANGWVRIDSISLDTLQ